LLGSRGAHPLAARLVPCDIYPGWPSRSCPDGAPLPRSDGGERTVTLLKGPEALPLLHVCVGALPDHVGRVRLVDAGLTGHRHPNLARGHPQLRQPPAFSLRNITDGASLFLVGLFKKLAVADRTTYAPHPSSPVQGLLSKQYAAERRSLIDPQRAHYSGGERYTARHVQRGKLLVRDRIEYQLPLAPLGAIAQRWVHHGIETAFAFRRRALEEIFPG